MNRDESPLDAKPCFFKNFATKELLKGLPMATRSFTQNISKKCGDSVLVIQFIPDLFPETSRCSEQPRVLKATELHERFGTTVWH